MNHHPMIMPILQTNQSEMLPSHETMLHWAQPRSGIIKESVPKFNTSVEQLSLHQHRQVLVNGIGVNRLLQQQMGSAVMLTQSLDSVGEVSNSLGSDDKSVGMKPVNTMLMNMNIPQTNFSKALNFQKLAAEGLVSQTMQEPIMSDECESDTLEYEGSVSQSSIDISIELGDQQHCPQQSDLMSKFRQLREWQQQQQVLLMTQQQTQLDLLRDEQERVQLMIAKQRQIQWGGSSQPPRNGFRSPKRSGLIPSTMPQSMSGQLQSQMTGLGGQRGPATVKAPLLPPQMHLTGQVVVGPHGDHPHPSTDFSSTQKQLQLLQQLTQQNQSDESLPPPYHKAHHQEQKRLSPREGLAGQEQIKALLHQGQAYIKNQLYQDQKSMFVGHYNNNANDEDDDEMLLSASQNVSDEEVHDSKGDLVDFNHNRDTLDFREKVCVLTDVESGAAPQSVDDYSGDESVCDDSDCGNGDCHQEYEEENSEDNNEDDCQCDHTETQFDEIPVPGLGATKKTFEQLLEEELCKENERMEQGSQHSQTESPSKKTFLKRGEGVARFLCSPKPRNKTSRSDHKAKEQKPHPTSGGKSSKTLATQVSKPAKVTNPNHKMMRTPNELSSKTSTDKIQEKHSDQNVQKSQNKRIKEIVEVREPSQQKRQWQAQEPPPRLQLNKPPPRPKTTGLSSKDLPKSNKPSTATCNNTDGLGETSFQARVTARAEKEEEDVEQLQEFELLEQFADDNASFLSNVSAVNRALQKNKEQQEEKKQQPLESTLMPPTQSLAMKSPPVTDTPYASHSTFKANIGNTASGDLNEASPQTSENILDASLEQDDTIVDTEQDIDLDEHFPELKPTIKPMTRKIASTQRNLLSSVQVFSDCNADPNKNQSDSSNLEEMESGEGVDNDKEEPKTHQSNNVPCKAENIQDGKEQYLKESRCASKQCLDEIETNDFQFGSDGVGMFGKDNTEGDGDLGVRPLDFEDDLEAWNDSQCEEAGAPKPNSGNAAITRSILSRENATGDTKEKPFTPPTSQLVKKLFPKLRQEKLKPKVPPELEQRQASASHAQHGDGIQTKLLHDKLLELEREIEKFRSENYNLTKLRKEREEGLAQLKKEMAEFEKQKNEELKHLQEFKAEEMKKLRREKKQFEQFQQNARAMPNKKERDEMDLLKTQLADLQEEVKRKEVRWNSSMSRLHDKCKTITAENTALQDEIKILESKRLLEWQHRETAPKCKTESSKPATFKKSMVQPSRSPKPESQPITLASADNALGLSTNLDLDDSDLRASEPQTPSSTNGGSPRMPSMSFTPIPFQLGSSASTSLKGNTTEDAKRQLPRKRATVPGLANTIDKGNEQYEEISHPDGKIEKIYNNGAREILFTNGTRRQVSAGGGSVIVSFFNGDIKQILPDQRIVYFYSDVQTTHTTYPDGLEILQFPNQQIEKHYPDGTKEITFPDQTIKYLFPNGIEESICADGTVIRIEKNGEKTIEFPNGQREVHTLHYKSREYPDGTVKTVYPNGNQETRYSSGRVRVKDNLGNVISDNRIN